MKKGILIAVAAAVSLCGMAQKEITGEVLKQLQDGYSEQLQSPQGASMRALHNAIGSNKLKSLALNHDNRADKNTYFNTSVKTVGITDQKSSGRCWLFTGLNVLRQKMIARHGYDKFEFSQIYLFFYDQLEKSNLFLQSIIDTRALPDDDTTVQWLFRNPVSDGGTYTGVADLVNKYGLVPSGVMLENFQSNNTSEFNRLLKSKLRQFGINLREMAAKGVDEKQLEQQKVQMMAVVYRMLALNYGEPVKEFTWAPVQSDGQYVEAPKHYTPQEFYKQLLCSDDADNSFTGNLLDVVMLMNDPSRDYYKVYEIDLDRHSYEGHNWLYVNLPIDEIKLMAIDCLKDSTAMYLSCDVAKCLNSETGWLDLKNYDYESLFGTTFDMDKRQRILSFDSGSSHAMTLMAVDIDADGNPTKWKVENSWGEKSGHKGFLLMTDQWFNEYVFRLVVPRKYASKKVLKLLRDEKPVRLPAWDPMFLPEE